LTHYGIETLHGKKLILFGGEVEFPDSNSVVQNFQRYEDLFSFGDLSLDEPKFGWIN